MSWSLVTSKNNRKKKNQTRMTDYWLSVSDKDEDGGAEGGGGSGGADRSKLNVALSEVEKIEMYLDNATTRIIQTFKDTIVELQGKVEECTKSISTLTKKVKDMESRSFTSAQVEDIKESINYRKVQKDEYFKKTLLVTGLKKTKDFKTPGKFFEKSKKMLTDVGLEWMLDSVHKYFLTTSGSLRLTYLNSRDSSEHLISAKKQLKEDGVRHGSFSHVRVSNMVPKRFMEMKQKLLESGRRLKTEGNATSYDVVIKDSIPRLRVYSPTNGVRYVDLPPTPDDNDSERRNKPQDDRNERDDGQIDTIPVIVSSRIRPNPNFYRLL